MSKMSYIKDLSTPSVTIKLLFICLTLIFLMLLYDSMRWGRGKHSIVHTYSIIVWDIKTTPSFLICTISLWHFCEYCLSYFWLMTFSVYVWSCSFDKQLFQEPYGKAKARPFRVYADFYEAKPNVDEDKVPCCILCFSFLCLVDDKVLSVHLDLWPDVILLFLSIKFGVIAVVNSMINLFYWQLLYSKVWTFLFDDTVLVENFKKFLYGILV